MIAEKPQTKSPINPNVYRAFWSIPPTGGFSDTVSRTFTLGEKVAMFLRFGLYRDTYKNSVLLKLCVAFSLEHDFIVGEILMFLGFKVNLAGEGNMIAFRSKGAKHIIIIKLQSV
ncbi:MAG TPA: hypothetical protein PKW80_05900 [Bacteroidales bacterium]|nr:hypothetical protein [Bacteroidales bacterium]